MKKILLIGTGGTIAGKGSEGKSSNYCSGTLSVKDIISAVKGLDKRQAVSRTEDLLNMVNLKDVADKKIKSYSGGMKSYITLPIS